MDWNDLRFFLAVARTQSLTKTAAALQVSQSTVSRRIATLEGSLKTALFAHHQTGYFLTDAGQDVLQYAEEVEAKVLALQGHIAGRDLRPSGTVRLATAVTLASYLIIPALPRFHARYPDITLEVKTGIDTVSMSRHDADIALRLVRPQQQSLKIRQVGEVASAVYGAESYLARYPEVRADPQKGAGFISWDPAYGHLPAAKWLRETLPDAPIALVTTSLISQIAAVKAGVGLAVLPAFIAGQERELLPVIPAGEVFSEALWLVTQEGLMASARVRAVADFLIEIVADAQLA